MLINPRKQYRIQNKKKGITSQTYFHLDPKRTHRNRIMQILWVYREEPKEIHVQFRDEPKLYYCEYIQGARAAAICQ